MHTKEATGVLIQASRRSPHVKCQFKDFSDDGPAVNGPRMFCLLLQASTAMAVVLLWPLFPGFELYRCADNTPGSVRRTVLGTWLASFIEPPRGLPVAQISHPIGLSVRTTKGSRTSIDFISLPC